LNIHALLAAPGIIDNYNIDNIDIVASIDNIHRLHSPSPFAAVGDLRSEVSHGSFLGIRNWYNKLSPVGIRHPCFQGCKFAPALQAVIIHPGYLV